MTSDTSARPVSRLRARMIEDMTVRGFKEDARRDYPQRGFRHGAHQPPQSSVCIRCQTNDCHVAVRIIQALANGMGRPAIASNRIPLRR